MRSNAGGASAFPYPMMLPLLVLLAAILMAACGQDAQKSANKAAPAVTFVTIKGESVPLNALRGKVVLVNFWATDCPVCLKEMPALAAMHQKYQARGYETVAVAMWYDPPIRVVDYVEKNPLPFKIAFDPIGEHARAFGEITLTPTTFVIDKRGNIVSRILGEPDFRKLHELLEKKLGETL